MTATPPDEAIHIRGETLTPESPRPLHPQEPSSIPVLENQMDPVFNDTATYEKPKLMQDNPTSQTDDESPYEPYAEIPPPPVDGNHGQPSVSGMDNVAPPLGNPLSPSQGKETTTDDARVPPPIDQPAHAQYTQQGAVSHQMSSAGSSEAQAPAPTAPSGSENRNAVAQGGVDFQSLLSQLAQPASNASSGTVPTSSSEHTLPHQSTSDTSIQNAAGLPPRPPTQEQPNADNLQAYHPHPNQNPSPSSTAPYAPPADNNHVSPEPGSSAPVPGAPGAPPGSTSTANGLPPPPGASFQQPQQQQQSQPDASPQGKHQGIRTEWHGGKQLVVGDVEPPWPPEIQKKYDEFLREERIHVTEGHWDRFPQGSRLFVGNLPTERVTKRDLFHVFHKYGTITQISIKQAYGFIQFTDANACRQALQEEQGGVIRGRKIHLEISKPQRNSRSGQSSAEQSRTSNQRRSRSPEYTRGGPGGARSNRPPPFSDFRDEPGSRRRDDYRPPRSPSPRGPRGRDGYRSRDRTPERYDRRDRRRSRSPYGRDRRYRSPSPRGRSYDAEPDHFSRRSRDPPKVQIIAADDVDRNYVYHVEKAYKAEGVRTDALIVNARTPMLPAVQRFIDDGAAMVVTITRNQPYANTVNVALPDPVPGSSKVGVKEYNDIKLDVAIGMTPGRQPGRMGAAPPPYQPPGYPLPSQFPLPQVQPQMPTALPNQNPLASLISSLDGPSLQQLLNALQQAQAPQAAQAQPQQPFSQMPTTNPVDLASLLSNLNRMQNPAPPAQSAPQLQSFGVPVASNPPTSTDPNMIALLAKALSARQPTMPNQPANPQLRNIVDQLAKWKQ
ncbi:hypothetical protein VTN49DRAFT_1251 [Thermomyces lanuginosus]|uniref:uncharacterized protein n=1 Tax=Thermomyces lanuginosus TaxID=5541 RepID=UPI003741F089